MSTKLDLLMRLDSEFQDRGFKSAEASAKVLGREMEKLEQAERSLANMQMAAQREAEQRHAAQLTGMDQVGRGFTAMGLLAAAGLGVAAKAASDWESAWAGVMKTVDGSEEEMAALEGDLRALAKTLPVTHEEIAGIAEAAGQLGVKRQDIAAFTKTMVDLGVSTNLTSDEAATGLAQLGNVMGVLPSQAANAGAALVALGNDGASTERDILAMSLRIAGAGRTIGLSEAEVMGFASALSSVGIEAEVGGSSLSRVMVDISQAVDEGGAKLDLFARVSGQSTEQFAQGFRTNAAAAVASFIEGLGRMQTSGQSTFAVLDELELSEIRVRDTLLRASSAGDLLRTSIDLGSRAWEDNLALLDEANRRYETNASKVLTARNRLNDAAIDIGGNVLPALAGAAERVGWLADAFTALPDDVQALVVAFGSALTAITLVGGAALMAIPKLAAMNATLAASGPHGAAFAGRLSTIGTALTGPWGLALAGASLALGVFAEKQFKAGQRAEEFRATLDQQTGALTDNSMAFIANELRQNGLFEAYGYLAGGLRNLTEAAAGNEDALRTLRTAQAENEAVLTRLAAKNGDLTAAEYDSLVAAQDKSAAYRNMFEAIGAVTDQNADQVTAQKEIAEATGQSAEAADGYNTELIQTQEAAEKAREEIDKLIEAFENYGEATISGRDANRDYQESLDDAAERLAKRKELEDELRAAQSRPAKTDEEKESRAAAIEKARKALEDYRLTVDAGTKAGRENQEVLEKIATSALHVAAQNFAAGEGIGKVTTQVMAARGQFIDYAVKLGMGRKEAERLADQLGLTRTNVDTLRAATAKVPTTKTTTFTAKTETALEQLAAFQRAVDALKGTNVRIAYTGTLPNGGRSTAGGITFAEGGVIDFAEGGTLPRIGDQRPRIEPNHGDNGIRWAETGAGPWEAFISGNPAYRGESVANWYEVGRRLGIGQSVAALAGAGGSRTESRSETYHTPIHIAQLVASDVADFERQSEARRREAALREL